MEISADLVICSDNFVNEPCHTITIIFRLESLFDAYCPKKEQIIILKLNSLSSIFDYRRINNNNKKKNEEFTQCFKPSLKHNGTFRLTVT